MNMTLRRCLPAVLAVASALAGCDGQLTPQAVELLEAGKEDYRGGQHRSAVEKLDAFLEEHSRSDRADEACYYRGLARYGLGDLSGAAADFEAAIDRADNPEVAIGARVARGDVAYERSNLDLAAEMYRAALEDIERGQKPEDHARYRLGCVLQRQGKWLEADVEFDRVIYLFPDTDLAERAADRVRGRAWTVQAGAYTDRKLADRAARELRSAGLPAQTRSELKAGRPLFVVSVGRFPTYEEAATSLEGVRSRRADAFVTTTR